MGVITQYGIGNVNLNTSMGTYCAVFSTPVIIAKLRGGSTFQSLVSITWHSEVL